MRKKLRLAVMIGGGVLLVVAVGLGVLYWALKQEPEFYRRAIQLDPVVQKQASDQMLQRAAALQNDLEKQGQWHARFSAEQINGWLAVDLVENHPDALPKALRDPRVAIQPDGMTVACRLQRRGMTGVVTLTVEPYMQEPNVLALRIHKARAGLVPMPLAGILKRISEAVARMDLHLRWQRQADGDPVALISIPPPSVKGDKLVRVETLKLGEGEIYLAGTTGPREANRPETEEDRR